MISTQCSNCGGTLTFNIEEQKLKCEYCQSTFEVEQIPLEISGVQCSTCGAELLTVDISQISCTCPYCGNNTIVANEEMQIDAPDYVAPFKVSKKEATKHLEKFLRKHFLTKQSLMDHVSVQDIHSLYVPYYFFTGTVTGSTRYEAIKSNSNGEYEVSEHYEVYREGSMIVERDAVDASTKMDNNLMDSIEPFDFTKMKQFDPRYLLGFSASVADDFEVEERARTTAIESLKRALRSTVKNYHTVNVLTSQTDYKVNSIEYGIMPVYLLNVKDNGNLLTFVVNGQTGKVGGTIPLDVPKAIFSFSVLAALLSIAVKIVTNNFTISSILGMILSGFTIYNWIKTLPTVKPNEEEPEVDTSKLQLSKHTKKLVKSVQTKIKS